MKRLFFSLCLVTAAPAYADSQLPDTPTGKAAAEWLAALNSGDRGQIEAMLGKYHLKTSVDGLLQSYRQRGGYDVLRVESSDPGKLVVIISAKDTDLIGRQTFRVDPGSPDHLDVSGQGIPAPPEFRPQRLTQQGVLAALRDRAQALHASDRFSGAVLIAKDDRVLLEKAWGVADRQTGEPVTLRTKFRLGSINKMFTAVAVLQLVAQGRISLDDAMGEYLPDYPNKSIAQATIRQLLDHTAGAGDIFGSDFDSHRAEMKTHSDYIALYGSRAPAHVPGASDGYDNYGFILLAAIIEKMTGQSYYDYVRERVFLPAGMKDTDSLPEDARVSDLAPGYMWKENRWVSNADTLPYRGTGAGGGYSTLADLMKFAQALEAGKLLPAPLLAQATAPQNQIVGTAWVSWSTPRMPRLPMAMRAGRRA
jgi:D-alanyl-D-alanine carboxypeptidase